ncbi:hypothetical protein SAY87_022014 [Trapa incisa]|uniref:Pectinesterase n=1 Tax=Trapa incisa TaxID=236973 RepID=A0AAN7JSG3_9MYRT|nr:hypothetical protein SAY87_022014 [Trapa incisa]
MGSNKKVAVVAVSSVILVAIGVVAKVGIARSYQSDSSAKADSDAQNVTPSMKAVEALCAPTDYKQTCVNSLKDSNSTDPKELIKVGFNVAVKNIQDAVTKSAVLHELEKDPRAAKALQNCKELMDDSISDLKRSFEKVGHFDMSKVDEIIEDLKVWLSAAITYQETCFDGFENTTSDAGKKMREALKIATQMTSNGLAMVTEIYSTLKSLNLPILENGVERRRLMSDNLDGDMATWMSDDMVRRRLMSDSLDSDTLTLMSDDMVRRRLLAVSLETAKAKADLIVAKDGSGKYKTINEALEDIPKKSNKTFVLYIKEGIYHEQVQFNKSLTHLVVIGDGPTKTRITFNKNFVDGTPTFKTATVAVLGEHFIAKDIGFENSAGAEKHQAVALRVQADHAIFYNCHMDGYQDTLYAHTLRQYYRDCVISGTIDFVFGDAAVVFQNCTFLVRKPLDNQQCIVTAQGRKERRQPSAIVLQNCKILPHSSYGVNEETKSYLGRPWKEYSRTIIMESYIDAFIDPEGWLPWAGNFGLNTCFYTEFNNTGPGAGTKNRVKWRGIKKITAQHAADFAPARFISGNLWIRQTGVPYTPGMFHA